MVFAHVPPPNVGEKVNPTSVEMVVARYNEPLEWLSEAPFNRYPISIYNKGSNENFFKTSPMVRRVVPLKNVGREGHTYLHHIVENYDRLAEVTLFLPGSTDADHKKPRATRLLTHLPKGNVFACSKEDVREAMNHFRIDAYLSTHESNRRINADARIQKSDLRPFGLWYEAFFSGITVDRLTWSGMFAVSRAAILQRPKAFYERLSEELDHHHNPETGHYLERSWGAVFWSDDNVYV